MGDSVRVFTVAEFAAADGATAERLLSGDCEALAVVEGRRVCEGEEDGSGVLLRVSVKRSTLFVSSIPNGEFTSALPADEN